MGYEIERGPHVELISWKDLPFTDDDAYKRESAAERKRLTTNNTTEKKCRTCQSTQEVSEYSRRFFCKTCWLKRCNVDRRRLAPATPSLTRFMKKIHDQRAKS